MDSIIQRNRPILNRPGRPLIPSLEQSSAPAPSVATEEPQQEANTSVDKPKQAQIEQQLEEAFSTLDTAPETTLPGQALAWSGFETTMEEAVAKEIWTEWRYTC